jgi:hypothetical protein
MLHLFASVWWAINHRYLLHLARGSLLTLPLLLSIPAVYQKEIFLVSADDFLEDFLLYLALRRCSLYCVHFIVLEECPLFHDLKFLLFKLQLMLVFERLCKIEGPLPLAVLKELREGLCIINALPKGMLVSILTFLVRESHLHEDIQGLLLDQVVILESLVLVLKFLDLVLKFLDLYLHASVAFLYFVCFGGLIFNQQFESAVLYAK